MSDSSRWHPESQAEADAEYASECKNRHRLGVEPCGVPHSKTVTDTQKITPASAADDALIARLEKYGTCGDFPKIPSVVFLDAATRIDALRTEVAGLTKENESLRGERDDWQGRWEAYIDVPGEPMLNDCNRMAVPGGDKEIESANIVLSAIFESEKAREWFKAGKTIHFSASSKHLPEVGFEGTIQHFDHLEYP